MKIQKQQYILPALALVLAFVLSGCASSGGGIVQKRRGTGIKTNETVQAEEVMEGTEYTELSESGLYILTKLDTERKVAAFQNTNSGRQSQYAYDTGTRFLDKYGNTRSMTSFLLGDVVEIDVSGHTQQLTRVQMSGDAWVYEDIVNYSVNKDIQAFTIGKTKYSYDSKLSIFSGEEEIRFEDLGESDVLRAVGIDKKLISLSVTKGHGYLALTNTEIFENSFICIGDKIFEEVTKDMQIEVPEGDYLVTVANNGYGGSREVTIERNLVTNLDLDELKGEGPKICKITFDVGVEGAKLFIDGKQADYSAPVEVQYGIHTIAVEAEGYDTITEKLVVNSSEAEIEIALAASSGSSSNSDEQDNSSGSSDNNTDTNDNSANNDSDSNQNDNSSDASSNNDNHNTTDNNTANTNTDSSQTDYLTTLYNLLTSINNADGNNSNTSNSYDDLRDQ